MGHAAFYRQKEGRETLRIAGGGGKISCFFSFFLPHEFLMNMTKSDEYDEYLRMMMRMPLPPPTDDDHEHVFAGTVTCIEYGIG